jgi:hypothetical protein
MASAAYDRTASNVIFTKGRAHLAALPLNLNLSQD